MLFLGLCFKCTIYCKRLFTNDAHLNVFISLHPVTCPCYFNVLWFIYTRICLLVTDCVFHCLQLNLFTQSNMHMSESHSFNSILNQPTRYQARHTLNWHPYSLHPYVLPLPFSSPNQSRILPRPPAKIHETF